MNNDGDPEHSWRVLFQIALSHGEWVKNQKITYKGFLTFLWSADLLNSKSTISLLLVEQLWRKHCIIASLPPINAPVLPKHCHTVKMITEEEYLKKREEVYSHGLLKFEGFTDIMKLISVRCYQTQKCIHLYKEVGECLLDAIVLSSEDNVGLKECIFYTANRWLKPFIHRNLVHRSTKMLLEPTQNEWTMQASCLIKHILNTLQDNVIVPLFNHYTSNDGEMNHTQYKRFVEEIFSDFTALQHCSALSIFQFGVNHQERDGCPRKSSAKEASADVFAIDSFVDALLMLSVVVFADESQFPNHLSITSKVWSTFECYLCPAITKLNSTSPLQYSSTLGMAADPLFLDDTASELPYISCIFPALIPVEELSSILVSGLNITVDPACIVPATSPLRKAKALPSIVEKIESSFTQNVSHVVDLPGCTDVKEFSHKQNTTLGSSQTANQNLMEQATEKRASSSNNSPYLRANNSLIPHPNQLGGVRAFYELNPNAEPGSGEHSINELYENVGEVLTTKFPWYSSSIAPNRKVFFPYIDNEPTLCIEYKQNRLKVLLPENASNIDLFKLAVFYNKGESGSNFGKDTTVPLQRNNCDSFYFIPIREIVFSLRDSLGETIFASKKAVLKAPSTHRVIPLCVLHILQKAFYECAENRKCAPRMSAESEVFITMSDFEAICYRLRLIGNAACAVAECQKAVSESVQASFLVCGTESNTSNADIMLCIAQNAWDRVQLNFSLFMEAVAVLGLRTSCATSSNSASDLIKFLLLVLPVSDSPVTHHRISNFQFDNKPFGEFILPSIDHEAKKRGPGILPYSSQLSKEHKNVLHYHKHSSLAPKLREACVKLRRSPKTLLSSYPVDILAKEDCLFCNRVDDELNIAFQILKKSFLIDQLTIEKNSFESKF